MYNDKYNKLSERVPNNGQFKLDRIRFRWKGAWSGTAYIKDDIVLWW